MVAALGAGGMGEVYRARDTRLEREVAIKVLPAHLSGSPQFRERFEREAKAISQLNHPHICTLHDVGHENGTSYLVMELLEGESLADRVAKGPLPMDLVLRYGSEIAQALDRAHRQGIVHRDLKPANIMITRSGAKLLDFGLAREASGNAFVAAMSASESAAAEPTQQKPLTQEGTIVGTFQYMSPEQLEGLPADARTDIFALGAVLYEMATGRRAFDGKTRTSLIAAIVSTQPAPISTLQPLTPPAFEHVVEKCLAKDRDDRWQSAHDVAEELRWIRERGSQAGIATPVIARRRNRERLVWAALLLLTIGGLGAALLRNKPSPGPSYHFTVPMIGPGYSSGGINLRLSPDGGSLLFSAANDAGKPQLFIRRFDSFEARPLQGTEGAANGAWSRDGKSIVFTTAGKLRRISSDGGTPQVIADLSSARGLAYGDGVVLAGLLEGGLRKITVATGAVEEITRPDPKKYERGHILPHFLSDGDHFLFVTFSQDPRGPLHKRVYAGSLASRETKLLGEFPSGVVAGGGYIFYVREGTGYARRFDEKSLEVSGEPITVAEGIRNHAGIGTASASVAGDGTVAWRALEEADEIVLTDMAGSRLGTMAALGSYGTEPRMSPDGTTLLASKVDARTGTTAIEAYGIGRATRTRLTFGPFVDFCPVLTPDGSRLYFASDRTGVPDIYTKPVDGSEPDRLVIGGPGEQDPVDISPDGKLMLYRNATAGSVELRLLPLSGGESHPLVGTPSRSIVRSGRFSPDGQRVIFEWNITGRFEIYVKSLDSKQAPQQVTTDGATSPMWSSDGTAIVFRGIDERSIFRAAWNGKTFDEPRLLFTNPKRIEGFAVVGPAKLAIVEHDRSLASPPAHVIVRWPQTVNH